MYYRSQGPKLKWFRKQLYEEKFTEELPEPSSSEDETEESSIDFDFENAQNPREMTSQQDYTHNNESKTQKSNEEEEESTKEESEEYTKEETTQNKESTLHELEGTIDTSSNDTSKQDMSEMDSSV